MKQLMHQRRMLNLRMKGEKLIPDAVLKKIADLRVPEANQFLYQAVLEKLLREA